MSDNDRKSHAETLREFVASEQRAMHTITFVRVEAVDHDALKADVSFKSDPNIIIENCPIASTWARDGVGVVVPIAAGDEGLVLHPKEPMAEQIQARGPEGPTDNSDRRFELDDAVLLPMLWLDEDATPERSENELVMKHDSGSYLRLDEKGVHVGPELYIDGTPFLEHTHPHGDGPGTTSPPNEETDGGAPEVNDG